MGVQGNFFINLLVTVFLLFNKTEMDFVLLFSTSTICPLVPSKPLRENFSFSYFIRDIRFELLKDFPLEKINTDSSMLVFPDPFGP